jgi:thiol-disulfide isomerase/thioredoxin
MSGGMIAWKRAGKPVKGVSESGKLSSAAYTSLTRKAPLVLVDFGAVWCPPCKKMEPVVAELKKKNLVTFINVDGGVNTQVMEAQQVEALPTFILYNNGKEVWRKQGIVKLAEFEEAIRSAKSGK